MHFNQIIDICVRDLYALLLKCTGFDSFLLKPDVLYHKTHHRHLIDHREMKTLYSGVSVPKLSLRTKRVPRGGCPYMSNIGLESKTFLHYITKQNKRTFLESCNMSQCRERSERRKNRQFGINEHYLYIFNR